MFMVVTNQINAIKYYVDSIGFEEMVGNKSSNIPLLQQHLQQMQLKQLIQ
jgi:hypothetical protein